MQLQDLTDKRTQILQVMRKYGADNVRVFGSVAKDTATDDSDVDFLVTLDQDATLFALGALYMDLKELLGCDVDVVSESALSRHLRDEVIHTARTL